MNSIPYVFSGDSFFVRDILNDEENDWHTVEEADDAEEAAELYAEVLFKDEPGEVFEIEVMDENKQKKTKWTVSVEYEPTFSASELM